MKPPSEMSLDEIRYLIHVHEWITETERRSTFIALANIESLAKMIIQRIKISPLQENCDCHYCEEALTRKPKTPKAGKEKPTPITFSLDKE